MTTLYSSVRKDGDLSGEIICLDCLIEGKTQDTEEWQRLDGKDSKACQICGASAIDKASLEINRPMIDFINSISTGNYLKYGN